MKHNETPEGRSVRLLRVGEQVRHILSELLQRGDVHDDVLQSHLVSVTEVREEVERELEFAASMPMPLDTLESTQAALVKAIKGV